MLHASNPQNGGSAISYLYFISYTVVTTLVLFNLVVAVMLQNFSSLGDLNPKFASNTDVEGFIDAWCKLVPYR